MANFSLPDNAGRFVLNLKRRESLAWSIVKQSDCRGYIFACHLGAKMTDDSLMPDFYPQINGFSSSFDDTRFFHLDHGNALRVCYEIFYLFLSIKGNFTVLQRWTKSVRTLDEKLLTF